MKIILYIIKKEFKQIFRNKGMLPIIFILPVLQLVILSNAATYEIKNIQFGYVDADNSRISRGLIEQFEASTYFNVLGKFPSEKEASQAMQKGKVDAYLNIPTHFERDLQTDKEINIGVFIDAIDGAAAGVINVYVTQMIQNYNKKIATDLIQASDSVQKPNSIDSIPLFWYNQTLNYKTFMVPGILVLLVTMITLFLSGMNIVREKEIGTLEQINVTPIRKSHFIIGKLFPFWIIGMGLLTIGLILAKVIFNTPMLGNLGLLYAYTSVYILVILGMGLFISNFTDTQQQAMFIAWFFVVIFILMSGLFTPIESMPKWAQLLTEFNPIKYFVEIIRMVMLKGSGFVDIFPLAIKTLAYAIVMNGLAVWSYKKTT
jgi:ABC-2 type transport system permease protein